MVTHLNETPLRVRLLLQRHEGLLPCGGVGPLLDVLLQLGVVDEHGEHRAAGHGIPLVVGPVPRVEGSRIARVPSPRVLRAESERPPGVGLDPRTLIGPQLPDGHEIEHVLQDHVAPRLVIDRVRVDIGPSGITGGRQELAPSVVAGGVPEGLDKPAGENHRIQRGEHELIAHRGAVPVGFERGLHLLVPLGGRAALLHIEMQPRIRQVAHLRQHEHLHFVNDDGGLVRGHRVGPHLAPVLRLPGLPLLFMGVLAALVLRLLIEPLHPLHEAGLAGAHQDGRGRPALLGLHRVLFPHHAAAGTHRLYVIGHASAPRSQTAPRRIATTAPSAHSSPQRTS